MSDLFEEFNSLAAEKVLRGIALAQSADGRGLVCPICGHGKHGDGIRPRVDSKGRTRWKCFGTCGTNFSNVDLAAAVWGMNPYNEAAVIEKIKAVYNLEGNDSFSFRGNPSDGAVGNSDRSQKANEPRNYAKLYKHCRMNYDLKKFVDSQGGTWRGLTFETLSRAGCVLHGKYKFGSGECDERPAIIFPYDDLFYFVRSVVDKERRVSVGNRKLYEAAPITIDMPNFVSEGELDALSIAQVVKGFGSVATGGVNGTRMMIQELEKRFGASSVKPRFIVSYDNDEAGHEHALTLCQALRAAGYPAEPFFLEEQMAGKYETRCGGEVETYEVPKVDANDLLQQGNSKLFRRLLEAAELTNDKLANQAAAMSEAKEREQRAEINKNGLQVFSLAEYFDGKFFRDVSLSAKYSTRKTGFANLDAKQIFLPGVYTLGALAGAGKTTFAWQLLSQLADAGEFCIFCSYEMSALELYTKTMARELFKQRRKNHYGLALSSADIRRGAGNGIKEINELAKLFSFSRAKLHVAELTNTNVVELFKRLKPLIESADKPPVIALDYLQIIPSIDSKATTKEKIDDTMLRLKNFQRDTNATVIVISAFNRACGKEAEYSSFRESSSIEYSSDCIWALQTNDDDAKRLNPRPVTLKCLKNRAGGLYKLPFNYYAANDYFEPYTDDDFPPVDCE